jgi:lysophospholipase L1-like esterase
MASLAEQEQVPLLDLSTISGRFLANMGPEESKQYFCHIPAGLEPNYPDGCQDDTHFQQRGAKLMAELLVGELEKSELPLKQLLIHHKKVRLYLAGDSTMADYGGNEEPMAGWGQLLGQFFEETVEIHNFACCGRSSRSFLQEGRLERILQEIQAEDYLLIQFAHNDEKLSYEQPAVEFRSYLQQYVDGARSRHAYPVLVTPVERQSFDPDGKLVPTHEPYVTAMKQMAAEEGVALLDMNRASRELLERLGAEASSELFVQVEAGELPNYPDGHCDHTHFRETGARRMAGLAAGLIAESDLKMKRYLIQD